MSPPSPFDAEEAKSIHLSHLVTHASSPPAEPLPASVVLPNTYWSSVEKTSFFLGLARHSRWRPDIIVEEIGGGKTVADVCSYIELLDQHSAREPRQERRREALPGAREVSDEWIAVEESLAEGLRGEEAQWQKSTLKRKRDQQLKEVKKTLRAEGEVEQEDVPKDDHDTPTGTKRKHQRLDLGEAKPWKEGFKDRKRECAALWKQEDLLSYLDGTYLKILDSMVRIFEDAEQSRELEQSLHPGEDIAAGGSGQIAPSLTNRTSPRRSVSAVGDQALTTFPSSDSRNMDTVGNSQIDPSLLALGTAFTRHPAESHPYPQGANTLPVASSSNLIFQSTFPDPALPQFSSLSQHTFSGPSKRRIPQSPPTEPCDPSLSPPPALPPDLSPTSRQRLRKRLWSRRKRALLNGLPVSEVSTDIRKLKPGRKPNPKDEKGKGRVKDSREANGQQDVDAAVSLGPGSGPSEPSPGDKQANGAAAEFGDHPAPGEVEDESEGTDSSESVRKRKPRGCAKFLALNVDAAFLRADGLDLFHLGKLGTMTSLLHDVYSTPHESRQPEEEDCEETPPALSYHLLLLLRAHVAHFVTRLVAHAIVQKEVQARQKRRIKGTFETDRAHEIKAENIYESLAVLGKKLTSKHVFKRLKHAVRTAGTLANKGKRPQHAQTQESDGSESPSDSSGLQQTDDEAVSEDSGSDSDSDLDASSLGALPLAFTPRPTSALFWNPTLLPGLRGGDEVLLEDTDQKALEKELRAEAHVEDVDQEADRMHEQALWAEIGVEKNVPTGGIDANPEGFRSKGAAEDIRTVYDESEGKGRQSLRFRRPGGAAKSRVYIESDEDV